MKVGDYVTIQAIKDQSECRWVVLTDLEYKDYGGFDDIDGGIIRCIADTKREAGKVNIKLNSDENPSILISGTIETLSVGGIFVK